MNLCRVYYRGLLEREPEFHVPPKFGDRDSALAGEILHNGLLNQLFFFLDRSCNIINLTYRVRTNCDIRSHLNDYDLKYP